MPSGTGAQLAISRTGSLDVPVADAVNETVGRWQWQNMVSESIEHTKEELEEGALTGNHDAPESYEGTDFGQGDINIEPNPIALGTHLYAITGVQSNELVTDPGSTGANSGDFAGQGVWTHHFIPRTTDHDNRTFNEPHCVMVYKDVGSAWFFNGSIFSAHQLTFTAGQLVSGRSSIMAREPALQARTNSIEALVNSGGRPWVWDTASVEIGPNEAGLAASKVFENIELDLQVPHEGIVTLDGTKLYQKMPKSDFRRLIANMTLCFQDQSEYVTFRNYEDQYLRITATNVNTSLRLGNPDSLFYFTIQIDIPKFKFTSFSAPIAGPNRIIATAAGKGQRGSDPSSWMVRYKLTNTASTY